MKVSVIMPAFNEEATVARAALAVLGQDCVGELIIVDDCSTDGTAREMAVIAAGDARVRLARHEVNRGKGAALRTGFAMAACEVVLVQDADLEYDPKDYARLIGPIAAGQADAVFGSRFVGSEAHRVLYFWHSVGNTFLTLLSNMFTNLNLTDMETCHKVIRRDLLQRLTLVEDRFGIEPEITAKLAREGARIYEVAISYHGRTYAEGKKIGWRDGLRAVWCIVKYGLEGRSARPGGPQ